MTAVCLLVFLIAVDGGLGSRFLHAPLVSCTLLGLVMGDPATGLYYGSMCEIISLILGDEGGMGVFAAALMPAVLKGGASESLSTSLMAVSCACACGFEALMTLFVPMARKAAEKRNVKSLGAANFIPLLLRGVLAAVIAGLAYANAADIENAVSQLTANAKGVLVAVDVFAFLLPFVGIAVVLRNLSLKDHYGAFLAGAACAMLAGLDNSWTLLACAAIGFGIAFYDFHRNKTTRDSNTSASQQSTVTKKGSAEKWW